MWLRPGWERTRIVTVEEKNERLAEIIKICDNLFYGDYYEKGGEYKTKEELDKHIKDSLKEDFIEFYGAKYADKINAQIDKQTIAFGYQIIGRNSIEDFLNEKEREYLESKGLDVQKARSLTKVKSLISDNGNLNIEELIENKEELFKYDEMVDIMDFLGYDKSIFETEDINQVREFVREVKDLSRFRYSDIPEVDADMKKLDRFVSKYLRDLEKERESEIEYCKLDKFRNLEGDELRNALSNKVLEEVRHRDVYFGKTDEEIMSDPFVIMKYEGYLYLLTDFDAWSQHYRSRYDPIVDANSNNERKVNGGKGVVYVNSALFDDNSLTEASHNGVANTISLGIKPSDDTVIHEFIHAIENSGFQRNENTLPKEKAPYTYHLRQYQMIDEVCVEYFAMLIYEARIAKGKEPIINQTPSESLYRSLFPIMAPFIERMMPDIKAAKMVEKENPGVIFERFSHIVKNVLHKADPDPTPASFFGTLIGQDNFDKIALLCNEIMELRNPNNVQEVVEALEESGMASDRDKFIDTLEKDLSALTEVVMTEQDMAKLEHEKGKKGIFDLIRSIKELPEVAREAVQERDQTMIEVKQVIDNPELEQGVKDIEVAEMVVPVQNVQNQPVQQNPGYQTPSPSAPTSPVRNDDMVM